MDGIRILMSWSRSHAGSRDQSRQLPVQVPPFPHAHVRQKVLLARLAQLGVGESVGPVLIRVPDLEQREKIRSLDAELPVRFVRGLLLLHRPITRIADLERRSNDQDFGQAMLIVSGHDHRHAMQQSFETGATFYLQKPVDRQKLTTLFRTVRGTLFENHCRHVRISFHTEVACKVGGRTLRGTSWNLSQGGLQVEVEGLKNGDKVEVSFHLPESGIPINAMGEVVWAEGDLQGISFTAIGAQSQAEIRRTIAQVETPESARH